MPHQFSYPDKAAENMAVLQYANADAGAEGIAQLVLEAASAAVKVRLHAVAELHALSWASWHPGAGSLRVTTLPGGQMPWRGCSVRPFVPKRALHMLMVELSLCRGAR